MSNESMPVDDTLSGLRGQIHSKLLAIAEGNLDWSGTQDFARRYAKEVEALNIAVRAAQPKDVTYSCDVFTVHGVRSCTLRRGAKVLRSGPVEEDRDRMRLIVAEVLLEDAVSQESARLLAPLFARLHTYGAGEWHLRRSVLRGFVAQHKPSLLNAADAAKRAG